MNVITFTRDGRLVRWKLESMYAFCLDRTVSDDACVDLNNTFVRYGIAPGDVMPTSEFVLKTADLFSGIEDSKEEMCSRERAEEMCSRERAEEMCSRERAEEMCQHALWLSANLIEPIADVSTRAASTSSSSTSAEQKQSPPVTIDQDFQNALEACRNLCRSSSSSSSADENAATAKSEEEFVMEAIAALKRLRPDEGCTAIETEKIAGYITCDSLEQTTARRRYACETDDLTIAPLSMTDVKRLGERNEEATVVAAAVRKRKRTEEGHDASSDDDEMVASMMHEQQQQQLPSTNIGVFEIVNVREYVWTETVHHLVNAVRSGLCSVADVLFKSLGALPHGAFLNRALWPMSRRKSPFMSLAIRNSSESEIEGAYNMLVDNSESICIDDKPDDMSLLQQQQRISSSEASVKLKSDGMLHLPDAGPGFEARQVLMMELLDVFRNCMFPIRFSEDASFVEIVDTALQYNHIAISDTNGVAFNAPGVSTVLRGNILSMCYLPAKSVLVDGSPRILSVYEDIVYNLESLREKQLAAGGTGVRNFDSIICEPVNYMVIRKDSAASGEEPPLPSSSCDFGRSGVKQPYDNLMYEVYDNFYDEVFDLRERYSGVFVVQDSGDDIALTATCVKGISDPEVWRKMREFFTARLKKKKSDASNFYKSRPLKVPHRDLAEFIRSLGFEGSKGIRVERTTLRTGDLFVWNNKTPCLFSLRSSNSSNSSSSGSIARKSAALLAELDYFPRSQCLETEDKKRMVRMLSNNVRSTRHTQVTNSYEWNAAHRLVYVWKKREDIVHGYLMWDPATKTPLYYQNCPWRRLDEVRGVRHYAGVTQTAVSIDLLS